MSMLPVVVVRLLQSSKSCSNMEFLLSPSESAGSKPRKTIKSGFIIIVMAAAAVPVLKGCYDNNDAFPDK